jgi:dolichyl-phosphate beta-glucosyltransferase
MAKPFLSVVIPTYNIIDVLPRLLIDIDMALTRSEVSYELLIVDDASHDGTHHAARALGGLIGPVKVIDNAGRRGMQSAVALGMVAARGSWRMALLPYAPDGVVSAIERVLPLISGSDTTDVIVGFTGERGVGAVLRSFSLRAAIQRLLNVSLRILFHSRVRDFFTPMSCYRDAVAERIFSALKLNAMPYVFEPMLLAERYGYRIGNVPIGLPGEVSAEGQRVPYLQILRGMITMRWWFMRRMYR